MPVSYTHLDVYKRQVWAKRAGGDNDPSIINPRPGELKTAALAAPTAEEANKLWNEAAQEMINNKIIIPMVSPDPVSYTHLDVYKRQPTIFFIENNLYGVATRITDITRETRLTSRGAMLGIPAIECDGMDVVAVHRAMAEARRIICLLYTSRCV